MFEAGGPFRATGGPFGPPVNMLAEALFRSVRMVALYAKRVICSVVGYVFLLPVLRMPTY